MYKFDYTNFDRVKIVTKWDTSKMSDTIQVHIQQLQVMNKPVLRPRKQTPPSSVPLTTPLRYPRA